MTLRIRRFILYALVFTFFITGTALVYYAQGWRLDLKTLTLTEVGGIYIRSFPQETDIFLDGEEVRNKSGLIQSGTLIGNLFPRNYRLTISLPGWRTLERNVSVQPSLVTELDKLVLVPEAGEVVATSTENFWPARELIFKDKAGVLNVQGRTIPGDIVVGWTENFGRVLTRDSKKSVFFSYDSVNATSTDLSSLFKSLNLKTDSAELATDPASDNNLIYKSPLQISILDIQRSQGVPVVSLSATASERIAAFVTDRSWIAWSTYDAGEETSGIAVYERPFRTRKVLAESIPGKTVKAKRASGAILGLAQNNGEFYIYRPADNNLTHLASDVRDFAFSGSADKVAVLGSRGLEILSLNGKEYWRFNLTEASRIASIAWYKDDRHLFVSYPEETRFLDLGDDGLQSFTEVAASGKAQYDPRGNLFYYLKDNQVFTLKFPD